MQQACATTEASQLRWAHYCGRIHRIRALLLFEHVFHGCSVQEADQKQQQGRASQLLQWRAPWQTQSRAPRLRQRAAEACIRRWQVILLTLTSTSL